jgi:hypothetical protein
MKAFFALCCFLATAMLFPRLAAAEWFTDFEKAKAESLKTNRPIFILFTNSDAAICLSLDRAIFSQKKFLDYADKKLVLMKADFPASILRQPRGLAQQNSRLRADFKVSVLPTMLLLDANGKLFTDFVKADGGTEKHRRKMNEIMDFDPPKRYADYLETFVKDYKPPKPAPAPAAAKTEEKTAKKPAATKKQEKKADVKPRENEETTIPDENTLLIPLDPEGDFQEWLKANRAEQENSDAKETAEAKANEASGLAAPASAEGSSAQAEKTPAAEKK